MDVITWFLLALPLALDVFAAGLVFGLSGLERSRWFGVALGFALLGGTLIAIGIVLGDTLEGTLGNATKYLAAIALILIGVRGIGHGICGGDSRAAAPLDTRRIVTTGFAVAVDKLAVGLSFAVLDASVGVMTMIVAGQAFVATLLGLLLGRRLGERAGDVAEIIAGLVFTALGLVIIYQAIVTRS
jgi:putative Mn2+ efflux pump MntP